MAFTFLDTSTGKAVHDVACTEIIARKPDGSVVKIVENGVLASGVAYTDTMARNAIKTKTQINALSAASTAADIVAALKA